MDNSKQPFDDLIVKSIKEKINNRASRIIFYRAFLIVIGILFLIQLFYVGFTIEKVLAALIVYLLLCVIVPTIILESMDPLKDLTLNQRCIYLLTVLIEQLSKFNPSSKFKLYSTLKTIILYNSLHSQFLQLERNLNNLFFITSRHEDIMIVKWIQKISSKRFKQIIHSEHRDTFIQYLKSMLTVYQFSKKNSPKDYYFAKRQDLINYLTILEEINIPERKSKFKFRKPTGSTVYIWGVCILGASLVALNYLGSSIIDSRFINTITIGGFILGIIPIIRMKKD